MTALRELVGAFKHDAELVRDMGYSQQADRITECANRLDAALSAQEERVCGRCLFWDEFVKVRGMGICTIRFDKTTERTFPVNEITWNADESCSRFRAKKED